MSISKDFIDIMEAAKAAGEAQKRRGPSDKSWPLSRSGISYMEWQTMFEALMDGASVAYLVKELGVSKGAIYNGIRSWAAKEGISESTSIGKIRRDYKARQREG